MIHVWFPYGFPLVFLWLTCLILRWFLWLVQLLVMVDVDACSDHCSERLSFVLHISKERFDGIQEHFCLGSGRHPQTRKHQVSYTAMMNHLHQCLVEWLVESVSG